MNLNVLKKIYSKNNNTTKKTNFMKLLLSFLIIISFLPVFGQNDIENDTVSHVTIDFVGVEDHIISEILEIPGTNLQSNGTISLEITINNMIELEEKLSECSLLDECEILLQIYNLLQSQDESNDEKRKRVSGAVDIIRERFGYDLIKRARSQAAK